MNDQPQSDHNFDERLSLHLLRLLDEGPRSLNFLITMAQGAYPTDVLARLRTLQQAGRTREITKDVWATVDSTAFPYDDPIAQSGSESQDHLEFPEPHPVDFDWRFTKRALRLLAGTINTNPPKTIAVLGAPTLFKYLREQKKCVHLYDRNEQVVSFLKKAGHGEVTHCDLFRYSGQKKFDCVIADPPWYLDHYRAFIETGRQMLRPGNNFFLSVLPLLTRPSAESDRTAIVKFASERGFDLVDRNPGVLEYLSPAFEVEALKAEGLDVDAWRSGDLYTFALSTREVDHYKPEPQYEELWRTFTLGRTVIKVKWDGTHGSNDFDFENASETKDMRLRSVSRRSPPRSKINLWTSRNIALRVTRPDVACAALQLLSEGHDSAHASIALAHVEHLTPVEADRLQTLLGILIEESQRR